MSFSVSRFATDDGPESLEDGLEIPGFPKPSKPEGFTGNLQGHLEKLSSNARSIHHVLETLCGGLDRLEKKMDTNSSQVEARLANIVHHISGEADEDTMSAWSSLAGGGGGGAGSPTDLGTAPSLRRRGSFGMQMASCSEDPPFDFRNDKMSLDEELANVGRDGDESEEVVTSFGGVVERAKDVALQNEGGGRGEVERAAILTAPGNSSSAQATLKPTVVAAGPSASKTLENTDEHQNPSEAKDLSSISSPTDTGSPREEGTELPIGLVSGGEDTNDLHPQRRRSNQDDQSDGSNSKLNSARAEEGRNDVTVVSKQASSVDGGSVLGEDAEGPGEGNDFVKTAFSPQASIDSGVLDSRLIARQRWIWAFGRICQLVRRRKRKQFEIMSQRATDRTVRMGSRVSVVEKRLDETTEHLLVVNQLRDKSGSHTAQIKNLNEMVKELCKLLGMEEKFNGIVHATKKVVEEKFKSDMTELETRLASGHRELETNLESEIRRNGTKLDDMDDRYARSEEALRRAEERIGEVQEEMHAVGESISDVERRLRVDEDRLGSLENLKKAHQRRLSELRVQLESGTPAAGGAVPIETEPEETDEERMARLLKTAGTATEFLAEDLDKIFDSNGGYAGDATATAADNAEANHELGQVLSARSSDSNIDHALQELRHVSVNAVECSRLCNAVASASGQAEGDEIGPDGGRAGSDSNVDAAVRRVEALCGHIQDLLSTHDKNISSSKNKAKLPATGEIERQGSLEGNGGVGLKIDDIVCPNGRKDLVQRLTAARDALLPVIGERSSVGSLRVAFLGLTASVRANLEEKQARDLMEERWNDLRGRVSGLDTSVSDIKDSLHDEGHHRYGSLDMESDNGEDLEERLGCKADVSWVQRELQRLWDALNARAMAAVGAMSPRTGAEVTEGHGGDPSRPRSAPPTNYDKENHNPETAGQEEGDLDASPSQANSRVISGSLPSSALSTALGGGGGGGGGGSQGAVGGRRASFNEGASLIKDLMKKTSRLEQQVATKADNEEVMKALASVGNKLRKVGIVIPAMQEELANKIERKDLAKLVSMVSNGGGTGEPPPGGHEGPHNNGEGSAVVASRLNSKFRCLSCDRPLPTLGPPGPPKLGASGLSMAGAGTPRSPQKTSSQQRLKLTAAEEPGADKNSRPGSPATTSPAVEDVGDVAGWGGGSSSMMIPGGASDMESAYGNGGKDAGARRRQKQQHRQHHEMDQPPGRLEPLGANGEHMAGVLSRYPRMMPPPSRIRTAAGGGIGSRPSSSSGGRI
ncbi:unnamed protein product [Ectocarpus sp. 6 AP-2014]